MAPNRSLEESDASMRKRLVESLSASFPGSALSRALHSMDDLEIKQEPEDPLSSSCFAELRLDKGQLDEDDFGDFGDMIDEEDDDELTSLAWLQDSDLLKNINQGEDLCPSPVDDVKENNDINKGDYANPPFPYNPQKHINSKPPYSFSCLIFMAIEDSPIKKLPVKDIYNWILTHFPYFQNAPTGWKNSVRHNLSLNKCFKKVDKEKGQSIGKGSLWCIDPDYRPNLLQALRKTPYHPYHQLQMLAHATPSAGYTILPGTPKPLPLTQRININTPSPHLFPFLSRRLAQSFDSNSTESDIDVANTLVSLKRAAAYNQSRCQNGLGRSRSPSPPEFGSKREKELLKRKFRASRPRLPSVVTEWPSEEHSYCVSTLPVEDVEEEGSDPDDEYDWGSEDDEISATDISDADVDSDLDDTCDSAGEEVPSKRHKLNNGQTGRRTLRVKLATPSRKRRIETDDEDEKMKIVEGADALLNLAGIMTNNIVPLRSISPSNSTHANNNNNNNEVKKMKANKNTAKGGSS